jgi:gamma-glutamyl-gamma-aminobutyrate hydrolase PuuD
MTQALASPLIGVTVELLDAPFYKGPRRFQLFHAYMPVLRAAGAVPVLIPGDATATDLAQLLPKLNGILMTGGDDADLRSLGGPAPTPECKPAPEEQQNMNLALVSQAVALGMPLLGVCYGMQMLGLAFDAPFIQHLPAADDHVKGIVHTVTATANSKLAELLGTAPFEVPSYHHQALAGPGPQLQASAWSPDGILEAIELPNKRFTLGVQWHPEKAPESEASKRLFSGFVAAASDYCK